jgi:inhibitor of cysteine peptidase
MLVISLEGNPTTGYMWDVAELDDQVLRQIGETEFKPESDAIGAGGVQTLRFETVNSGQTTLKLVYHRPWEEGVEPLETFTIQVVVR